MITVIKRGKAQATGVVRFSIGRRGSNTGSGCISAHALANPFKLKPRGKFERGESISRYKQWLEHKIEVRDPAVCAALNVIWRAAKQGDAELECFCAPLPCHGDVVKQVIEAKL